MPGGEPVVKYLNNRKNKSRAAKGQNPGTYPGSGQAQGTGSPSAAGSGQNQGDNKPAVQDEPAMAFMTRAWSMVKSLITYQASELDDSFSLGARRTDGNPADGWPSGSGQSGQVSGIQAGGQQGQSAASVQTDAGQWRAALQPGQELLEPPPGSASHYQMQQGAQAQQQQNPQQQDQTGQGRGQGQAKGGGAQAKPPAREAGQAPQSQPQGDPAAGTQAKGGKGQAQGGQPPQNQSAQGQPAPGVKHTKQGGTQAGEQQVPVEQQIHYALDKNLAHVKQVFGIPNNKGFSVREFLVGFKQVCPAFILFTEGLADKTVIDNFVLQPLMVWSSLEDYNPKDPLALARERLVLANQVEETRDFNEVIKGVLSGSTALFIEGSNAALLLETKGWEHRPVSRPMVENVVRGPQEAFNEVLIINVALIRSRLRTEKLVSEMSTIGTLSKADVAVMYLSDIANPTLVQEVRRRLNALRDVDYIPDTGILEQLIEDKPFSLMPQTLSTERPDRVAAYLSEGHVALLMSSTPFALVVPATFWALLHSPEDSYVRWPYGGLMRVVRVSALLIAMFLPALYLAIVNYHQAMLPPDLLFAIAAARERVPMPSVIEIAVMELSFELIREAGIRIPSIIGPTIGIVGALILGQAAVQANLISPLVIIIVSLTGLGSFAIPNYNLSFQIRLLRFVYMAAALSGGFVAITILMFIHMAGLSGVKSFGVPVLSPASPNRQSKDTLLRSPTWTQEARPNLVRPLKGRRQPPVTRAWDPEAGPRRGGNT